MRNFKKIASGFIKGFSELLIGVLLLFNPIAFTSGIIRIIGIILLVFGAINIIAYFRNAIQDGTTAWKLSTGILEIIGGLFCAVNPHWFIATFPALTVLYGLGILVFGVVKVESAVNMFRMNMRQWGICAVSAALTLICAVVIIFNPLSSTIALWMFIGISLIAEAVIDIIAVFFLWE